VVRDRFGRSSSIAPRACANREIGRGRRVQREPFRLLVGANLRVLLGGKVERPPRDLGPELARSRDSLAPTAQLLDLHRARLDLNNCSVNRRKGYEEKPNGCRRIARRRKRASRPSSATGTRGVRPLPCTI